jgi:hypothetical protein
MTVTTFLTWISDLLQNAQRLSCENHFNSRDSHEITRGDAGMLQIRIMIIIAVVTAAAILVEAFFMGGKPR